MASDDTVWVAKYGDGVILLVTIVAVALVEFRLGPLIGFGGPRDRAFVRLVVLSWFGGAVHMLYVGWFIARHTEAAIEADVRPLWSRVGIRPSNRFHRRMVSYDDDAGARRAAAYLAFWGIVLAALAAWSWNLT